MTKRRLSEADKASYDRDGYLVLRRVYDPQEMNDLKREYERLWLERLASGKAVQDRELPMESLFATLHEAHRYSETLRRFMLDARQFAIAEELLGEEALLIGTTCFFKAPQTKALPFHQDNIDNGCLPVRNCALWTSLDASDRSNGSLCFIPGSHRMGLLSINAPAGHRYGLLSTPIPEPGETALRPAGWGEIMHVETEPGDVIVFDGQTIHGSTSNITTDRFRRSFAAHFTGSGVEKVYANFNQLTDKEGNTVGRPANKAHGKLRGLLLPERKMAEGAKIY